jgi:nitroreductase/NAD-dependent dihydropyrimidine dehydrogenase PreA subunit
MAIMHSLYREGGTVTIDEQLCSHCAKCAAICPAEVLGFENGHVSVKPDSPFGCIACGHCMMSCPEGAVRVTGRGISPEDLRPLPPKAQRAGADQLAALMQSRRSVRHFREEEMDPALLERMVEMAASAPMGIPPWDVGCVTVCGREKVQWLAAEVVQGYQGFLNMFKPWLLTCLRPFQGRETNEMFRHFILPLARTYVEHHRRGRDMLFYNAPAVLIFHHSPYADPVDAAIACTYAMLAAESMGLGTTIIGGAPPILQRNKRLCASLGIPKANKPSLSMIVGYPKVEFKRTIQRKFSFLQMVSGQFDGKGGQTAD